MAENIKTMNRYFSFLVVSLCSMLVSAQTIAQRIYLSGTDAQHTRTWDFFCSAGQLSGKWRKIEVPSCWELQGFGEYTYGRFYKTKGLNIAPDAAALLAEHAGTDLNKIAVETQKMLKNLPEGTTSVTAADIEKNVGISRQFSIFELTKELSYKNGAKALRIAAYIGNAAKFAMPMATSALYTHFYRILKYGALLMQNPRPGNDVKAKVLGVSPYFFSEYDAAVRNYPVKRCMGVIALLKEYDYKGKGGDVGEATPAELMVELTAKILNS